MSDVYAAAVFFAAVNDASAVGYDFVAAVDVVSADGYNLSECPDVHSARTHGCRVTPLPATLAAVAAAWTATNGRTTLQTDCAHTRRCGRCSQVRCHVLKQ